MWKLNTITRRGNIKQSPDVETDHQAWKHKTMTSWKLNTLTRRGNIKQSPDVETDHNITRRRSIKQSPDVETEHNHQVYKLNTITRCKNWTQSLGAQAEHIDRAYKLNTITRCTNWTQSLHVQSEYNHQVHTSAHLTSPHLSLNREGRWRTTDDFKTSFQVHKLNKITGCTKWTQSLHVQTDHNHQVYKRNTFTGLATENNHQVY